MKCPVDQTQLVIADRQGIEIDYCPECRGVWLDRGELDKLIERSADYAPQAPRAEYREERHDDDDDHREYRRYNEDDMHRDSDHRSQHGKHRKKESFLGDMFDF